MNNPQVPVSGDGAAERAPSAPPNPPRAVAYAVAVGGVAAAFLLRWVIYGNLAARLPFAFFLPAAMVAAWYGGLGPGLLAAAMGLLIGDYFFLPPHVAWGPLGEPERTAITFYAMTATLSVVLFDNLHVRIQMLQTELRRRNRRADSASGPH